MQSNRMVEPAGWDKVQRGSQCMWWDARESMWQFGTVIGVNKGSGGVRGNARIRIGSGIVVAMTLRELRVPYTGNRPRPFVVEA